MLAVQFGLLHDSCDDAMEWRRSLPPTATQADAYLACDRGDWLLWQLAKLPKEQYEAIFPAIQRALDRIVERAIRRGLASIEGVDEPWAEEWRLWAEKWLNGEDRSKESAWATWRAAAPRAAAGSAACSAPRAAAVAAMGVAEAWAARVAARVAAWAAAWAWEEELRLQVEDIRAEIPAWPGE